MTTLERRYRSLLRAYPAWYRAERGGEILGTLLEASAADRSWPAARDAGALILGGLRVRASQHERQTTAGALRQAVLLAAMLNLAPWSSRDLGFVRGEWGYIFPSMLFAWVNLILGLLTLAVMAGAWFGRRAVVAVVALATAGLWVYQPPGNLLYMAAEPVLALAALAILAFAGERLPRSWLWLAGVWYLAHLLPVIFQASGLIGSLLGLFTPFGITIGAIGWSVIDARPMLATTLATAVIWGAVALRFYYEHPGVRAFPWYLWPWFLPAVLGVALAAVSIWRVRRQAVL